MPLFPSLLRLFRPLKALQASRIQRVKELAYHSKSLYIIVKKTWRKRLTAFISTASRYNHASPDILATAFPPALSQVRDGCVWACGFEGSMRQRRGGERWLGRVRRGLEVLRGAKLRLAAICGSRGASARGVVGDGARGLAKSRRRGSTGTDSRRGS